MKKYLLICLLPIFTTACSAKPSPQEELDLQARFYLQFIILMQVLMLLFQRSTYTFNKTNV